VKTGVDRAHTRGWRIKHFVVAAILVLSTPFFSRCSRDVLYPSPDDVTLITSDIDHFWRAFDRIGDGNIDSLFTAEYFNKGSKGLSDFIELRIKKVSSLTRTVQRQYDYYKSIRHNTYAIDSLKPQILQSFFKLKELCPDAQFPNVYFLIGIMNSGGTTSSSGLLIGTELYARSESSPTDKLNQWTREHVFLISNLPYIVAHELVHVQQSDPGVLSRLFSGSPLFELTLLEKCLNEGGADFIGELISGGHINQGAHQYADQREREIWGSFKSEMDGTDYSRWLFNPMIEDRPADLGYYVGYKICQSYYNNSADKRQAIVDILNINNAHDFLDRSHYDPHPE
jgi:hypothetical protein